MKRIQFWKVPFRLHPNFMYMPVYDYDVYPPYSMVAMNWLGVGVSLKYKP